MTQATYLNREPELRGLFMAALAGDEAQYKKFLHTMSGYLRAYFQRRLFHISDEAEDLVQETLIAVHTQRHTFDSSLTVTAWVYAIARYKMIDRLRRYKRVDAQFDELDEDSEAFAMSTDQAGDAQQDVTVLLGQLPDKQRQAIEWVKLQGLSIQEAALKMNVSVSDVKVSIHRGIKTLGLKMKETV
jgi:RNA polymerase sigma-70 factor (ECF subfamily)